MKLVEILASSVMHRHIFHQKPSSDERAQGSPSGLIVIEEGAECRDMSLAQVTNAPPDVRHEVHHEAMAVDLFFH